MGVLKLQSLGHGVRTLSGGKNGKTKEFCKEVLPEGYPKHYP